ncbi:MAG: hypothetical protein DMG57_04535 [Acidobacteria bacterium]|nr:MAG: hypothetical protein DMG57_04535 [Acidobacteriota bacterium]
MVHREIKVNCADYIAPSDGLGTGWTDREMGIRTYAKSNAESMRTSYRLITTLDIFAFGAMALQYPRAHGPHLPGLLHG